ncbi:hypothetical protein C4D60_Mb11t09250 [Musa balbisiana]|uniref:Peptidase S9 prolyl oligopeptidase catalytic domain-containing protein n=1 Tax=Musa balbisiana TaxID=52838 RepID=A0A4S8J5B4_MUSBA|nr:hypothetical protein C4D60_Mb11t09250 [Musa balbisiana]
MVYAMCSVLKSVNPSLKAMVVPQGAHHVDLRYSTKEDPMWLQNVRRKEINIIAGWINQFYADSKL